MSHVNGFTVPGPDELTEIECVIIEACAVVQRMGWTITPGVTRDSYFMRCCPMGACMILGIQFPVLLGAFASGFDLMSHRITDTTFYDMGRRIRERLERGELS